jgi:hypothetical protein
MLRRVALVRTDVSEERWNDYGGATFLRNIGYYNSHMV